MGRSPLRRGFFFVSMLLAWFALWPAPKAFGVSPAPDGGYPNGNTAEGDNALFNVTTGHNNTAVGNMHSLAIQPATPIRPWVLVR